MNVCIVVPHYDHLDQFSKYLPKLAASGLPLIVVDDASPAEAVDALAALLEGDEFKATLIRHEQNQGKGGTVATGLRAALASGYTHAVQVDADGQHDSRSIEGLVAEATTHPDSIICGEPIFDDSMSSVRFYARYITLFLVWLESLSTEIRDAMCGFRLYPLARIVAILDRARIGRRMAFDPELLVRAVWAGVPLHYVPVRVVYPEGGRSHFHYFRDNVVISWMHTRLLFGMVLRLPLLLGRKLTGSRVLP